AGVTTPAEILVEAGKPVRFVMTMAKKVPAVIDTFTPGRGADGIVKTGKLYDGMVVKFDSTIDGKLVIPNAPHCQNVATPTECVLAKTTYNIELDGVFNAKATRQIVVDKDQTVHFDFGFVDAGAGKTIVVGPGVAAKHVAYEVGPRSVTVAEEGGATHPVVVRVKSGATVI